MNQIKLGPGARKGWTFGRLMITLVMQGTGAPIIDKATTRTADGRHFEGVAIHLAPWRRNAYGDRAREMALVIAWERKQKPLAFGVDSIPYGPSPLRGALDAAIQAETAFKACQMFKAKHDPETARAIQARQEGGR